MPSEERHLLPLGTGFDVVRRGYDRGQVEEHLDRAEADLRILTADRDAAIGQATELARALDRTRAHVEDLRGQIDRLAAPPDTMEGLSERLQRMLRLAQDEAREMRQGAENHARRVRQDADDHARSVGASADEKGRQVTDDAGERARRTVAEAEDHAQRLVDAAHRQARETHEQAEAEAAEVRSRYDAGVADTEARRAAMETEHTDLMEGARAAAARIRRESEEERHRLDTDAGERRRRVEADFDVAMTARRAESMRTLARQEADARDRADQTLREAGEEAKRRIRVAEDDIADLRRLRSRVSTQLVTLREALGDLPGLDAFPDEQHADGRPSLPGGAGPDGGGSDGSGRDRPGRERSGRDAREAGLPRRTDPAIPSAGDEAADRHRGTEGQGPSDARATREPAAS